MMATPATQGSGGALVATGSTTVNITAVNDAPTANIVASAFGVSEDDGYRVFGGFSVSDVDAGGADIEFTLSVGQGIINLTNTTGLTLTGGANGTATMTFTGSISDINTALGTVTYKPDANFNGTDAITSSGQRPEAIRAAVVRQPILTARVLLSLRSMTRRCWTIAGTRR